MLLNSKSFGSRLTWGEMQQEQRLEGLCHNICKDAQDLDNLSCRPEQTHITRVDFMESPRIGGCNSQNNQPYESKRQALPTLPLYS